MQSLFVGPSSCPWPWSHPAQNHAKQYKAMQRISVSYFFLDPLCSKPLVALHVKFTGQLHKGKKSKLGRTGFFKKIYIFLVWSWQLTWDMFSFGFISQIVLSTRVMWQNVAQGSIQSNLFKHLFELRQDLSIFAAPQHLNVL